MCLIWFNLYLQLLVSVLSDDLLDDTTEFTSPNYIYIYIYIYIYLYIYIYIYIYILGILTIHSVTIHIKYIIYIYLNIYIK